jgi:hypothetical protein
MKSVTFWGSYSENRLGYILVTATGVLPKTATEYEDTNLTAGNACEYRIHQVISLSTARLGYVYSGIIIPLVESRV